MKTPLAGLLPDELKQAFSLSPQYRATQLFAWIQKGVSSFETMTNLPSSLKTELTARSLLRSSVADETHTDPDGTVKIRVRLTDGHAIESVLLCDPGGRKTACISSQAGCAMGCVFCKTATMGAKRNLECYEIVEQFLHLAEGYGEISNIVFMGMGEPLSNLANVRAAISVFHHTEGNNIGLRKITISTCGIARGIRELAKSGPYVRLAVSLPSGDETLRHRLMPQAKGNTLSELKDAIVEYRHRSKQRITFEVVLLSGVNDGRENALSIGRFIRGLDADVNLIPWNPVEGLCFERPDASRIKRFTEDLGRLGIHVVQRYQKGDRIGAACGQLASFFGT